MDPGAKRVQQDIIRLCHTGLDAVRLRVEVIRYLRKVMPIDAAFFATVDPTTLLFTSTVTDDILARATPQFLSNEFQDQDTNHFVQLARQKQHVQSLEGATHGALGKSARYRDILAPMALGDELRAALLVDGTCWGVMCLHRERSHVPYSAPEMAYLALLAPHIAAGLRAALVLGEATARPMADGPGVILLAEDLSLIATTPAADCWLAEIGTDHGATASMLPDAVTAVAARLLALERGHGQGSNVMPRVRVHTVSGRWVVLHASRLGGSAQIGHIAVILEEALPSDVAPIVLMGYGLSTRETEISALVLRGFSTTDIANELHISLDTIQDHLKSVFDKTGVRSRRDLVATIFSRHNLPAMKAGLAPSPRGGFRSM